MKTGQGRVIICFIRGPFCAFFQCYFEWHIRGGAEFGEVVAVDTAIHPGMRAATAVTPQGHRFEIWAKR